MAEVEELGRRKHLLQWRKALRRESEILAERLELVNKQLRDIDAELWG